MHLATKQLDGLYVINVKAFHERRAFMEAQLLKYDMKAEFVLDGDADELTAEIINKYFIGDNLFWKMMLFFPQGLTKACIMRWKKALALTGRKSFLSVAAATFIRRKALENPVSICTWVLAVDLPIPILLIATRHKNGWTGLPATRFHCR
jgi:hypothetical protein